MSAINGIASGGSAWAASHAARAGQMKDKMFAKVDTDGSGSVDKSELQGLIDHLAEKTGTNLGSADELYTQLDKNSDGSIGKDELADGIKSLMPPPSSTVDFAQQRGGDTKDDLFSKVDADGSGGVDAAEFTALQQKMAADRPQGAEASSSDDAFGQLDTDGDGSLSQAEFDAGRPGGAPGAGARAMGGAGGMPPPAIGSGPGASGASSDAGSTSSSTEFDPLDTNQDGVVSAQERSAGVVKDMVAELMKKLAGDGDDAKAREADLNTFAAALADRLVSEYRNVSANSMTEGSGSGVDISV